MIPRLKPYFGLKEARAVFEQDKGSVEKFEERFAKITKADYALSFAYGRSALYAALKALATKNSEILMPAYSCIVVPNAIVVSGNYPKFIDLDSEFNTSANLLSKKVTNQTKAVIPTNMFGYSLDYDELKRLNKKKPIVIQDNALALGAKSKNKETANQSDLSFYSLTWSKHLSTIEGGVLTTNNKKYYEKIKSFRARNFRKPSFKGNASNSSIVLLSNLIFNKDMFTFIRFLERNKIINPYSKYYSESKITLPDNFNELFSALQARIGLIQLKKAPGIIEKRSRLARRYNKKLQEVKSKIRLPKIVNGATYSHYCIKVGQRDKFIREMESKGVNLGKLFDYSLPYMKAYTKYKHGECPNSLKLAKEIVNLPLYPSLTKKEQDFVIEKTIEVINNL